LESPFLDLEHQLIIIKYISRNLNNDVLKSKWNLLISKNPDINFSWIYNFITAFEEDKVYKNVPLTTVDVERSFSALKHILDDKITNLAVKNLEALLALFCKKKNLYKL
jgi:hypothetical protein